jgi:hypothetical protein
LVTASPLPELMINPLKSWKFVEYDPSGNPVFTCTTLVYPPAVVQVTSTSLPCVVTEVICKPEALLVGLVPARNSAKLFWPSPSGSALAAAAGFVVLPKYWICQVWNGVSTVM